MTDHHDPLDDALRQHLHGAEPDDAGFSLRVMAALPAPSRRRRMDRWVRYANWLAASLAASGAAELLANTEGQPGTPQGLAALALIGLLVFWTIPSRWSRG